MNRSGSNLFSVVRLNNDYFFYFWFSGKLSNHKYHVNPITFLRYHVHCCVGKRCSTVVCFHPLTFCYISNIVFFSCFFFYFAFNTTRLTKSFIHTHDRIGSLNNIEKTKRIYMYICMYGVRRKWCCTNLLLHSICPYELHVVSFCLKYNHTLDQRIKREKK